MVDHNTQINDEREYDRRFEERFNIQNNEFYETTYNINEFYETTYNNNEFYETTYNDIFGDHSCDYTYKSPYCEELLNAKYIPNTAYANLQIQKYMDLLSSCNCCQKHRFNKPREWTGYYNRTPHRIHQFNNRCYCNCRHNARRMSRLHETNKIITENTTEIHTENIRTIKYELADLVDDFKEKLTDLEFKTVIEKIAELK